MKTLPITRRQAILCLNFLLCFAFTITTNAQTIYNQNTCNSSYSLGNKDTCNPVVQKSGNQLWFLFTPSANNGSLIFTLTNHYSSFSTK
jgi:hypothetical protein